MQIDPAACSPEVANKWLTNLVVPRPIGWVSTVDEKGIRNLAPFSAFNHVSGSPPMVMISFSERGGKPKDTLVNILATREFVVNLVSEDLAEQMNCTSGNYAPGVDEFVMANVTPVASTCVAPPRVGEAPASLECVLVQTVELPRSRNVVVFGEVVLFEVADRILDARGNVDSVKFRPLARTSGKGMYTKLGELLEMQRPP